MEMRKVIRKKGDAEELGKARRRIRKGVIQYMILQKAYRFILCFRSSGFSLKFHQDKCTFFFLFVGGYMTGMYDFTVVEGYNYKVSIEFTFFF